MYGYLSFLRKTELADGRYEVSTIGPAPYLPETLIFDNITGGARYREHHSRSADLNACHEDVVRRFLAGEITLEVDDEDEEEV